MYMYIPRIQIPGFPHRGKKEYLNDKEIERLFDGKIIVEEKLDGKLTRIDIRPFTAYEYFGEDLRWKHNIFYNKVPISRLPFIIGIDVYDHDVGEYFYETSAFWSEGIPVVPVLLKERDLRLSDIMPLLESKSNFGDEQIEGVVIKNYGNQTFGKIVNPKFDNDVDDSDHWLRKKRIANRIVREQYEI